jgi:hypothetical protein
MLEKFMWLVFAHAIGDYALQTPAMGENKFLSPMIMLAHSITWTALLAIALKYTNRYDLWKIVFLIVGHFIIDSISSYFTWIYYFPFNSEIINFYDQMAHFLQLLIVFFL